MITSARALDSGLVPKQRPRLESETDVLVSNELSIKFREIGGNDVLICVVMTSVVSSLSNMCTTLSATLMSNSRSSAYCITLKMRDVSACVAGLRTPLRLLAHPIILANALRAAAQGPLSLSCLLPSPSLPFAFTQHREIHGYNITSGCIRLCSAIVKQHRPDLRVALQDV